MPRIASMLDRREKYRQLVVREQRKQRNRLEYRWIDRQIRHASLCDSSELTGSITYLREMSKCHSRAALRLTLRENGTRTQASFRPSGSRRSDCLTVFRTDSRRSSSSRPFTKYLCTAPSLIAATTVEGSLKPLSMIR